MTNVPGESQAKKATCNDCNRQFCLSYNLPICKDVKKDEDVFTTCFQRDSAKDQAIVFTFIFVTVGLLIWAVIRPWAETYLEVSAAPGNARIYLMLTISRNSGTDTITTLLRKKAIDFERRMTRRAGREFKVRRLLV